jgi:hypothetical protein
MTMTALDELEVELAVGSVAEPPPSANVEPA